MSAFDRHQKTYFRDELNRSIPTKTPVDNDVLALALGDVDPEMPGFSGNRRASEASNFMSSFNTTNNLEQRDATCRAYTAPGPSMRAADARIGCGWWFSPSGTSVGALGTRRGPMNPNLAAQVGPGEWIWNTDDASRREATKVANRVKSCDDLDFYKKQNPALGWCKSMNRAIVVDRYGRPAFPSAPGGFCPEDETIITSSSDPACAVPPPTDSDSGRDGRSGGSAASISWVCQPNASGQLSPQCMKLVSDVFCSPRGSLSQALSSGYAGTSSTFNDTNAYLTQRGFTLNSGIVNDGSTSLLSALQSVIGLRQYAASADRNDSTAAAANLCFGTPFSPCNYTSNKPPPYDIRCVRSTAINMGYKNTGALLSQGDSYWNKFATWNDVVTHLSQWKQIADSGPDPKKQTEAIRNVYDISVKFPEQECTTFMMTGIWMGYDLPVSTVSNLASGERVYIAQDQEYVKMVSESGHAKYFVGSISQFDPSRWNTYSDAGRNYVIQPATKPRFYQNYNFAGGARGPPGVEFDVGTYPFSAFTAKIPNDSVSSVYIPPGYKVTIYQGDLSGQWGWPNFPRITLTSSVPDLRSLPGYDKTMSAVVVERS